MAILEELSFKQQKFCEEYLLSFNAYRAALAAGYSENTALKGDLLHVPKIQAYLKAAMSRSAARAELTHDMLLRELMKIAFCNMGNYYDDYGLPKKMHQLTDEEKAAVSYYQRADMCYQDGHIFGELVKIKLHNKMAALDRLCKHTGFYKANWQPLPEVDRTETAEDIAFEAEHGQTRPSAAFTQEVSDELYAQLLEREGDKMRAAGWYMGETVVEKSDVGGQKSDVGGQKSDVGGQKLEDGGQKLDVGGQKLDVGGQKSDVGGQKLDVGGQKSEDGGQSSDDDGVFSVVGDNTNNGVSDVEDGSPECGVGSSESGTSVAGMDSGLPMGADIPTNREISGENIENILTISPLDGGLAAGGDISMNQDANGEKEALQTQDQVKRSLQTSASDDAPSRNASAHEGNILTFPPLVGSRESRVPVAV